ncbi:MAG: mechanosensitive ion channel domain-containing protein [Oscillospiraceae bacterium]
MRAVEKLMGRNKQPNERLSRITVNFIKALLYLLTVIITAGALGLNTSSITAIASVLTLGLTLATQDIMSNVAGGLIILSTHPFSIGDVIESDGTVGTVRDISLNHTRIETADGQILLPNRSLSGSKIINYTTLGRRRIVRLSAHLMMPPPRP